ncbi:hypothetical protein SLEP1_g21276 [Rubroshorea leprosula]|uniref:Uncharacterized protein n=1 Tax=Rubroshorea leprosula TaxID=152421 RepID=A0AAV5J8M1_9ROSI|nr:hypothetical protein SLEP1_g21276 [Rubroshorea leprosula]
MRRHLRIKKDKSSKYGCVTSVSILTQAAVGSVPELGNILNSFILCLFLYLSPPEICNLSWPNRAFIGTASLDFVEEAK